MSKTRHVTPNIRKEFARFAIPAVIGMVVSSLYNIVNGIFVGQGVGEMGLGTINIVYPFIMLEIAITMLIAIGLILNILVLTFTTTACRLLRANDQLLTYAKEYIWWIALFGIIYMPGLGLSIFVRNDNAPLTS
jgi:Na+-driven multidrug efflux pump